MPLGPVAREASWRSGYAEDCKSLHPGSIPGEASKLPLSLRTLHPARRVARWPVRTRIRHRCIRMAPSADMRRGSALPCVGRSTRVLRAMRASAVGLPEAAVARGPRPPQRSAATLRFGACQPLRPCVDTPSRSPIAQLVEQATVNRLVAGSSPARGATKLPHRPVDLGNTPIPRLHCAAVRCLDGPRSSQDVPIICPAIIGPGRRRRMSGESAPLCRVRAVEPIGLRPDRPRIRPVRSMSRMRGVIGAHCDRAARLVR